MIEKQQHEADESNYSIVNPKLEHFYKLPSLPATFTRSKRLLYKSLITHSMQQTNIYQMKCAKRKERKHKNDGGKFIPSCLRDPVVGG